MPVPEIRGLVLSGGFSTRMGQDKGSLHWNGMPLLQHQVELLQSVTDTVFISCREEQAASYLQYGEMIVDQFPPHGPISGLMTAMQHHPQFAWLVLSVDMPMMDISHLQRLLNARQSNQMATLFKDPNTDILQPLAAIWEPHALPRIQIAWDKKRYSLRRILESNPTTFVLPDSDDILQNINRPEDLML